MRNQITFVHNISAVLCVSQTRFTGYEQIVKILHMTALWNLKLMEHKLTSYFRPLRFFPSVPLVSPVLSSSPLLAKPGFFFLLSLR